MPRSVLLPALIGLSALPSFGQDLNVSETLVVTATRTEQPVAGVTASVIVIDKQQIQRLGAQTLKDIFSNTPGLTLQYGTFPAASSTSKSSVSLRGLGATGTLWLLDGRRLAGEVKNPYDMDRLPASMVDRIEIVKGPMSALYGADALGGVINIITKRPGKELSGGISARYGANTEGDGEQTHLDASLRGSITDALRFSVYGAYQDSKPYQEQETTNTLIGSGRHAPSQIPAVPGFLNPMSPTGGRPFYFRGPGNISPMPLNPALVAGDRAAAQASFDQFRNNVNNGTQDHYQLGVSYREAAEVTTLGGRLEFDASDSLSLGLDINWFEEDRQGLYRSAFHPTGFVPPGGVQANPIVGHRPDNSPIFFVQAQGRAMGAIPAWDVPVNSRDDNERLDLSLDLRWQMSEQLTVNSRIYASDYEKRNSTTVAFYQDFGYNSEALSSASGMNANVDIKGYETWASWSASESHLLTFGVEYRDEERRGTVFKNAKPGEDPYDTRSVSYRVAYAQDEWEVDDDLNITLGLRWDEYQQDSYIDANGNDRPESKDSEVTLRTGAVKNISEELNIRAVYAQGFRVPDIREMFIQKRTPTGFQLGAQAVEPSLNKQAHELNPESVDSFELAVFGQLNNWRYELSAFRNEIEDRIEQTPVDANGDNVDDYFSFFNAGDAKTQGLELSINWQATDQIKLDFFWTELDTENKTTGRELYFNPERLIALGGHWQVSDQWQWNMRATHTGEQVYLRNGQLLSTDAYTLVNINTSFDLNTSGMQLFAGIDNVFDEEVDKRLGSNPGTSFYLGIRSQF